MHNMFDEGFPKNVKNEFIPAIPNDVDAALRWSDHFVYFLKGVYVISVTCLPLHTCIHTL